MKAIVLFVLLFGYGLHVYSQDFSFAKDDISLAAIAERQMFVEKFADSCLASAKSIEKQGLVYTPKNYFNATKNIDSLVRLYKVDPLQHIADIRYSLRLISCRGEKLIPEDLKNEFNQYAPKKTLRMPSWEEIWSFLKGLLFTAFSFGLLLLVKERQFVVNKIVGFLEGVKVPEQESYVKLINPEVSKIFFYYVLGDIPEYIKTIEHVPLFISLVNIRNSFIYFKTNKKLKTWNIKQLLSPGQHLVLARC